MVHIFTDSTADIPAARARAMGVHVVPLSVFFGGQMFRDGIDMTAAAFYKRLAESQTLPTTTQVSPAEFMDAFKPILDQGDEIVGLFISSELSGTYASAVMAARELGGPVYPIDTRAVTFGLGLLVNQAVRMRDQGKTASEIAQGIEQMKGRLRLLAVVGTLEYLKKGGRLSSASAAVGSILGITPVIVLKDGGIHAVAKPRGRKNGFRCMAEMMEQAPPDRSLGIAFGHSNAPDALEACKAYFIPKVEGAPITCSDIGCIVGTHAGPGAVGLAYIEK
nr:DegV family protein [bacterium]